MASAEQAPARRRVWGAAVATVLLLATIVALVLVASADDGERGAQVNSAERPRVMDVHGLGVDPADGSVYLATHTGLLRARPGTSVYESAGGPTQDLMGFSVAGPGRFFASGHPGPGQDLPNPIGLIRSGDRGRSWRQVSLAGEADFHLLEAAGDHVYGIYGPFVVSTNGGRSWRERKAPDGVIDLAADPRRPSRVMAATETGAFISDDAGASWRKLGERPPSLIAWAGDGRTYAIEADGRVSVSRDNGRNWQTAGRASVEPAALATDSEGAVYVAGSDGSVRSSIDGGMTWQPRVDA